MLDLQNLNKTMYLVYHVSHLFYYHTGFETKHIWSCNNSNKYVKMLILGF